LRGKNRLRAILGIPKFSQDQIKQRLQVARKTKMIGVLSIIAGIQMLLVGFGVIKNNWKNDEVKAKNEKRLRIGGLIVLVGGVIRVSMEYLP
jgi:hypothetical protein